MVGIQAGNVGVAFPCRGCGFRFVLCPLQGMATAGRTKACTIVPPNHFGPIPGVPVGSLWRYRLQVSPLPLVTAFITLMQRMLYSTTHTEMRPPLYCGHFTLPQRMPIAHIDCPSTCTYPCRRESVGCTVIRLVGSTGGSTKVPTPSSCPEASRRTWTVATSSRTRGAGGATYRGTSARRSSSLRTRG